MNVTALFSKLGLSQSITQDLTLFLVMALASFFFGMFIGRYRLVSILVNIYIAFAIVSVIPERFFAEYFHKFILLMGIIVSLTLANRRLFEIYFTGSGSGILWRVFAMSFLEIALILSIVFSYIPKKVALNYVSERAYGYFASEMSLLIWMTIPILFLMFIHKRLNR